MSVFFFLQKRSLTPDKSFFHKSGSRKNRPGKDIVKDFSE
jgi:hypothetical protein